MGIITGLIEEKTNLAVSGGTGSKGVAIHIGNSFNGRSVVEAPMEKVLSGVGGDGMILTQCRLRMVAAGDNGVSFEFPIDPVVSIRGGNIVAKRYVAKGVGRGTIKELWSRDDWRIEIRGVLIGEDENELNGMLGSLVRVLNHEGAVKVECSIFDAYDIQRVVIEDYEFPFTKGLRNQNFVIKCCSDEDYNLIERV